MLNTSVSAAALEKSLSAIWQRKSVIANNIANEDTPGYKAKRLDFEQVLARELQSQNVRTSSWSGPKAMVSRIDSVTPRVYEDNSTIGRADGNNVQLENEQIELARVQIQYDALQQKLQGHYNLLKYAISGGK